MLDGGCFYAAEAVRLAGIKGLNYRQLRRLLVLVKGEALADRRWARFTFREVVALKVAYKLASGKQTNYPHPRLHFVAVERACERLRKQYGISDPLTEVTLRWDGPKIVAQFEGVHFETASGQTVLVAKDVSNNATKMTWLNPRDVSRLKSQLRKEVQDLKTRQREVANACSAQRLKVKIPLEGAS